MTEKNQISDVDDRLAAEYVLGVLDREVQTELDKRLETDEKFAAAVTRWRAQLADLDDDFEAVEPPKALIKKIEARIFGALPSQSWWQHFGPPRELAVLMLVVGVVLSSVLIASFRNDDNRSVLVAEVISETGNLRLSATFEPRRMVLTVTRNAGIAPSGRDLELWLIAGGNAPQSLGVLDQRQNTTVKVPAYLAAQLAAGAVLAVSDEPVGGSPTGAPTGSVLAVGTISAL